MREFDKFSSGLNPVNIEMELAVAKAAKRGIIAPHHHYVLVFSKTSGKEADDYYFEHRPTKEALAQMDVILESYHGFLEDNKMIMLSNHRLARHVDEGAEEEYNGLPVKYI